jgi:hypothetical protein
VRCSPLTGPPLHPPRRALSAAAPTPPSGGGDAGGSSDGGSGGGGGGWRGRHGLLTFAAGALLGSLGLSGGDTLPGGGGGQHGGNGSGGEGVADTLARLLGAAREWLTYAVSSLGETFINSVRPRILRTLKWRALLHRCSWFGGRRADGGWGTQRH